MGGERGGWRGIAGWKSTKRMSHSLYRDNRPGHWSGKRSIKSPCEFLLQLAGGCGTKPVEVVVKAKFLVAFLRGENEDATRHTPNLSQPDSCCDNSTQPLTITNEEQLKV